MYIWGKFTLPLGGGKYQPIYSYPQYTVAKAKQFSIS
jgi:hypothetical protein